MTDYGTLTGYQVVTEEREDFWLGRIFAEVPRLTVSEWADRHRMLSSEANAAAGRWTSFPFQRDIMDACLDHRYRRVVAMLPSQVGGKTEMPLNVIGYLVDLAPGPILMVEPTLEMARALSKDRIGPLFRDTPRLQGKLRETARMESDNTLLHKAGAGWRLTLVGSNAPSGLSMRPVMAVLFDEPDRYPPSAGQEGDVVTLGEARTTAFPRRISYMGGTPTIKGASRIEEEYEKSTMGKWHVPCPHCGFDQPLEWGGPDEPFGLKWERGKPETAQYLCAGCHALIDESYKDQMNATGRYIHAHPERDVIGFTFTSLVTPMIRWVRLVKEWLECKGNNERTKAFVNTKLARAYEMPGEKIDTEALASRRETYPAEVPKGVGVLTLGGDVQPDRLEATIWGFGAGEEAWVIRHHRIYGNTADKNDECWRDLEHVLVKTYACEDGTALRIRSACIDHGFNSAAVSDFVRPRQTRGVYAVKGSSEYGKPIVGGKPGKSQKYRVRVWMVGTDAAKDVLFPRLKRNLTPGPGYIHLPTADRADDEYLRQWANEKVSSVPRGGRSFRVYRPVTDKAPVESIDCAVYAYVALWLLGTAARDRLDRKAKKLEPKPSQAEPPPSAPESAEEPETPSPPTKPNPWTRRASGGFMQAWRQ